jgi:hypothetical protein
VSAMAATDQQNSRDVALAAIAEAVRLIGQPNEKLAQFDELEKKGQETGELSDARSAKSVEMSSRSRLVLRSLMGLSALACIGVAAFAWQSTHGQAVSEPISTSSVSVERKQQPAQPAAHNAEKAAKIDAGLPQPPSQAQTTVQRAAQIAPTTAPMAPDLAESIQMIARELANVEQGIDQLKTGQTQMVRDNTEIAEQLKATQEMARHNADLAEDLKAAQAQMARDNANFAEQLKVSQEQMANIAAQLKGSQEQIAHLVASEQKQRPRTLASSPIPVPVANSTRKPVPTPLSPQVRVQTQDAKPKQ